MHTDVGGPGWRPRGGRSSTCTVQGSTLDRVRRVERPYPGSACAPLESRRSGSRRSVRGSIRGNRTPVRAENSVARRVPVCGAPSRPPSPGARCAFGRTTTEGRAMPMADTTPPAVEESDSATARRVRRASMRRPSHRPSESGTNGRIDRVRAERTWITRTATVTGRAGVAVVSVPLDEWGESSSSDATRRGLGIRWSGSDRASITLEARWISLPARPVGRERLRASDEHDLDRSDERNILIAFSTADGRLLTQEITISIFHDVDNAAVFLDKSLYREFH